MARVRIPIFFDYASTLCYIAWRIVGRLQHHRRDSASERHLLDSVSARKAERQYDGVGAAFRWRGAFDSVVTPPCF